MNKGVLFVLSGPSGVGKGTVKAQLFEEFEKCLVFSVSATSRKPREGEVDGREYFFIDRDSFERKIRENAFLEHAEFAGNLYGTPREAVNAQLLAGRDVLLEIEVQGALQVMQAMPECVSLFILPPSFEVLEQRLRGRGTETDAVIERRLEQARRELPMADRYMYQLVNDTISGTYEKLREIYLKHSKVVHQVYGI